MNIQKIFRELETDAESNKQTYMQEGKLVLRELTNQVAYPIILGCEPQDKRKWLILPVSNRISKFDLLRQYPDCKGMSVSSMFFEQIGSRKNQWCLTLEQTASFGHSIYESFLVSAVDALWEIETTGVPSALRNTMQKWQYFFSKLEVEGLSSEERRGLFGEIDFLLWLLDNRFSPDVVHAWKGPYKEDIDFVFGQVGVEVKTTRSRNPVKIRISNEHQLSITAEQQLLLTVNMINESATGGRTLKQLVHVTREVLADWPQSLQLFEECLLRAGYYIIHEEQYDNDSYVVAERQFYEVTDGFPRINLKALPLAITNVKYDINVNECSAYKLLEQNFLEKIRVN